MSTAALASSSTTLTQESRPQAGPLPAKRGEIGFIEGVHKPSQVQPQVAPDPLPLRHPADHRPSSPLQEPINGTPSHSEGLPTLTVSDAASTSTVGKRYFFRHKRLPKFMGIHFTTLALLSFQILLFAGTVVGWVFAALAISASRANVPSPVTASGQNAPSPDPGSGSSSIFIHVAFAVIALAQLVFIERRIFRVRAERYMFKHPGEVLPTSLRRGNSLGNPTMAIAPWSRPSLPTYAAALAASGVGTGDVEDADIAQPPPPAYGKTRGSTLLLTGHLRDSLRVQAREHEQAHRASSISMRSDRPISFISRDEEWETRRDADRARRIQEAITVLEDGRPALTSWHE